eukprot:TRINITY_DN38426_c0_g1_i1.p1 TRINITY_DN38426_c0_g1~~TRINITY_DN38426_c0_g1_i1.p1  ORF type:complete len:509 (+),score=101.88 TRINITY_DN38426_c0_g1_i1:54-1580(+)
MATPDIWERQAALASSPSQVDVQVLVQQVQSLQAQMQQHFSVLLHQQAAQQQQFMNFHGLYCQDPNAASSSKATDTNASRKTRKSLKERLRQKKRASRVSSPKVGQCEPVSEQSGGDATDWEHVTIMTISDSKPPSDVRDGGKDPQRDDVGQKAQEEAVDREAFEGQGGSDTSQHMGLAGAERRQGATVQDADPDAALPDATQKEKEMQNRIEELESAVVALGMRLSELEDKEHNAKVDPKSWPVEKEASKTEAAEIPAAMSGAEITSQDADVLTVVAPIATAATGKERQSDPADGNLTKDNEAADMEIDDIESNPVSPPAEAVSSESKAHSDASEPLAENLAGCVEQGEGQPVRTSGSTMEALTAMSVTEPDSADPGEQTDRKAKTSLTIGGLPTTSPSLSDEMGLLDLLQGRWSDCEGTIVQIEGRELIVNGLRIPLTVVTDSEGRESEVRLWTATCGYDADGVRHDAPSELWYVNASGARGAAHGVWKWHNMAGRRTPMTMTRAS